MFCLFLLLVSGSWLVGFDRISNELAPTESFGSHFTTQISSWTITGTATNYSIFCDGECPYSPEEWNGFSKYIGLSSPYRSFIRLSKLFAENNAKSVKFLNLECIKGVQQSTTAIVINGQNRANFGCIQTPFNLSFVLNEEFLTSIALIYETKTSSDSPNWVIALGIEVS